MSRTHPTYCEHGKAINGGDFLESEDCPECDIEQEKDDNE